MGSTRVSCTALAGDPNDFLSATHCWINDIEARHNVAYVLDPGDTLALGDQSKQYGIEFEARSADSPMLQMMMQVCCSFVIRCCTMSYIHRVWYAATTSSRHWKTLRKNVLLLDIITSFVNRIRAIPLYDAAAVEQRAY